MVVSDEKLASEAGVEILKRGGNAVDAAVAVAFALAVVEPEAGNIGGGGFMLVRLASGQADFLDYRETAPRRASRDMYLKPDGTVDPAGSTTGYRSAGVPGTVAGLVLASHRYGKLPLEQVMEPAIRIAADGFPIGERLAALLRENAQALEKSPVSKRIFLKGGAFYEPGDILKQPELAATLARIAKNVAPEFYSGKTAHGLAAEMKRQGGIVTLEDLANYKPKVRPPLTKSYTMNHHDWIVITSPPPSSGGVAAIEALNILSKENIRSWDDPDSVASMIETMRRVFADRAMYLADSDFARVPVASLTSRCYADLLRASIDPAHASSSDAVAKKNADSLKSLEGNSCTRSTNQQSIAFQDRARSSALAEAKRGGHTTHFSVVDGDGNAVSNTYTLNDNFGSGVTTADGFLLNDEMDDFTVHPGSPNMFGLIQSEANSIAPQKRPLSSMMPTILLRDGKLSFITGSPGGPRIISATLLTMFNWMNLEMGAQEAINAPRFHQQWLPDTVLLEPGFSEVVAKELERRGYRLDAQPEWIGEVEAIGIDAESGARLGAPDPRRQGFAAGY
jgi:gamma-glutamyltranspeptidase/glutathione hydrolase